MSAFWYYVFTLVFFLFDYFILAVASQQRCKSRLTRVPFH